MRGLRLSDERGITLIEVSAVLLILGVLIMAAMFTFNKHPQTAKESGAYQVLTASYKVGHGEWMLSGGGLEQAYPDTAALVATLQDSEPEYEYITASFNGSDPSRKRVSVFRTDPRTDTPLSPDQVIYCTGVKPGHVICLGADEQGGWTTLAGGGLRVPLLGPDSATAAATADIVYAEGSTARSAAGKIIDGKGTSTWPGANGDDAPPPTTTEPPADPPAWLQYTFEDGRQGWTEDDTSITLSIEEGRTSKQSLRVAYSRAVAGTGTQPYALVNTGKVFKAGHEYRMTAWVRGFAGTHELSFARKGNMVVGAQDVAITAAWQQITVTYKPTVPYGDVWLRLASKDTAAAGHYVEIDDIRVEEIAPVAPVNTAGASISGTAQTGQTMTVSAGAWEGDAPITTTYQWETCAAAHSSCTEVAGATAATYQIRAVDIGRHLRARVTATNAAGSASVVANGPQVIGVTAQTVLQPQVLSGGTTYTLNHSAWPNGNYDMWIVTVASTNQATTTAPAGWTLLRSNIAISGSGSTGSLHSYYRIADGTGGNQVTFTLPAASTGTNNQNLVSAVRVRGAHRTSPIDTSMAVATTTTNRTEVGGLLSTNTPNTLILGLVGFSSVSTGGTGGIATPAGTTMLYNQRHSTNTVNPHATTAAFYYTQAAAGPIATTTVTGTNIGNARTHTVAIRPAP